MPVGLLLVERGLGVLVLLVEMQFGAGARGHLAVLAGQAAQAAQDLVQVRVGRQQVLVVGGLLLVQVQLARQRVQSEGARAAGVVVRLAPRLRQELAVVGRLAQLQAEAGLLLLVVGWILGGGRGRGRGARHQLAPLRQRVEVLLLLLTQVLAGGRRGQQGGRAAHGAALLLEEGGRRVRAREQELAGRRVGRRM